MVRICATNSDYRYSAGRRQRPLLPQVVFGLSWLCDAIQPHFPARVRAIDEEFVTRTGAGQSPWRFSLSEFFLVSDLRLPNDAPRLQDFLPARHSSAHT